MGLLAVAYHNGGLCLKDRNLVEGLFLKGDIQVLCTTNTLAHGINLPAHTVVIKSTQHFNKEKGLYMEYDRSTILQMSGRAGRPPFDDTGMVIIMTRRETVHLYENLLSGCEVVESQLLSCMREHLLAEIVQLTISDISKAIEWMQYSYLYVRMKRNPEHYAIKKEISGGRLEKHVQEICVQKVNELSHHQMVWIDEDGFLLRPLDPGRLMTKYYLRFDTMKKIMQTPENCSLEDGLRVVCCAEEIAWIQLRRNEKKILNEINMDKDGRLRFHILGNKEKKKKRIQTREEKIFILANDCLTGNPSVHDLSLIQDMNSICSNGSRISKCMKDYFVHKRNYRGTVNSALLAKSLDQKLWDDSPYLLKQLPGIGMVTAKALHSMNIKSFEALAEADPRRIEIVTGRKYPFGNHIKDSLLSLPPKVDVKLVEIENQRQGNSKLALTLTRISQSGQSVTRHYADMGGSVLQLKLNIPYNATVLVPIGQGMQIIKADFIFEEYIGIDVHQKLPLIKESNSNVLIRRNRKQASFNPPKELCPEGGHALEVEDDECKIITEKTVFEHIREKAKNFSLLSAFDNIRCPSLEVLLKRNHSREKRSDLHYEVVDLDDADRLEVPQQTHVNSPAELSKTEHNDINPYATLNDQNSNTSGSSNSMSSIVDTGLFDPEPEAGTREKPTEEMVFDHIRRKSKDFPLFSKLDCGESIVQKTELFSNMHPSSLSSLNTDFGMVTKTNSPDMITDATLTSYMETAEMDKYSSSIQGGTEVQRNIFEGFCETAIDGVLNIPKGVFSSNSVESSMYLPTFSASILKDKKRSSDTDSFAETSKKQHCFSRESKEEKSGLSEIRRQCCSLETTEQMKELESYPRFKSDCSYRHACEPCYEGLLGIGLHNLEISGSPGMVIDTGQSCILQKYGPQL
ncbi:hypothetical protein Lal_00039570 [Lupinus albus]|nr:hypothetical protein Lal_00039570 [Lupinus albus]